ncbi:MULTISPECIES: AraC family transcriptional regulator [Catenuloplanes]|uniref:AraC family transcriptional regulator n=1 Tax=Catenuloplanes niger TaxID=587534 RepID=A0AAE3ZYC2_9ACTN|nr:AraC family transcriptional regulator [Catenuloplanes niger]MDR7327140.1 AraC family transcriptional regulator [Catenuloplanes niger]
MGIGRTREGMPSRMLVSSAQLGWKTVEAVTYADPPRAEEFTIRPDRLLLVLITSGEFTLERRHRGAWHRDLRGPGSLCVVGSGQDARVRWFATSDMPMRSLQLHLETDAAGEVPVPGETTLTDPFLSAGAWALLRALHAGGPTLYADSVAQALVAHLDLRARAAAAPPDGTARALGARQIEQLTDYMRAHLADDLTVDDLASVVNVSKFHFIRTFAATTGLTPSRYLRRLRARTAAELLTATTLPIATVAARCGYRSAGQFAVVFRGEHGVSPSAYRSGHGAGPSDSGRSAIRR